MYVSDGLLFNILVEICTVVLQFGVDTCQIKLDFTGQQYQKYTDVMLLIHTLSLNVLMRNVYIHISVYTYAYLYL